MTTFFARKVNHDVVIPNKRVCGYQITNSWMPNGYSCGVKSGRDNGVVNQKLSRFSTLDEAEEKSHCAGNVNWLNYKRGRSFVEPKQGSRFEIKRPAFDAGDNYEDPADVPSIANINKRSGQGNRNIKRPAFLSPPIKARTAGSFDRLQAIEVGGLPGSAEIKATASTKKIIVEEPDVRDVTWLAEKARLTAQFTARGMNASEIENEFSVNPPLGRRQRTIQIERTITNNSLPINARIDELKQEIASGKAESRIQQATLMGQFALVLNDTNAVNALTNQQLTGLGQALARLNVPRTAKQIGIEPRFVDSVFYLANAGMINLFFIANVAHQPRVSLLKPVLNFAGASIHGVPPIALGTIAAALRRPGQQRRYIDLERGGLIDRQQLRAFANTMGGFGTTAFSIEPIHR